MLYSLIKGNWDLCALVSQSSTQHVGFAKEPQGFVRDVDEASGHGLFVALCE